MSDGDSARRRKPVAAMMRKVAGLGAPFRGSLARVRLKCGKPNCRCARGEGHDALYASYRFEGKTRVAHVPRAKGAEAARCAANWRRLKGLLEHLAEALATEWKESSHGRANEAEGSSGGAKDRAGESRKGRSGGGKGRSGSRRAGRAEG
jgi:hypothetical protein